MHNGAAPLLPDNPALLPPLWNYISDADHRLPPVDVLPTVSETVGSSPAVLLLSFSLPGLPHMETDKTDCPHQYKRNSSALRRLRAPSLSILSTS